LKNGPVGRLRFLPERKMERDFCNFGLYVGTESKWKNKQKIENVERNSKIPSLAVLANLFPMCTAAVGAHQNQKGSVCYIG